MNWVDLSAFLLLVFFSLEGLGRNFISELLDLLAFLVALVLAFNFYNFPANLLTTNFKVALSLANVIGFILVWFTVESLLMVLLPVLYLKLGLPSQLRV